MGLSEKNVEKIDILTGIMNKSGVVDWIKNTDFEEKIANEEYVCVYIDVQRFKAINELFGMDEGDKLLVHIAYVLDMIGQSRFDAQIEKGVCGRIDADRFVIIFKCIKEKIECVVESILEDISEYDLPFEIVCNAGMYVIEGNALSPNSIIDRAIMAQSTIKGSYTTKLVFFSDLMRQKLLTEQEITGMMRKGINDKEFKIYYQPQYNHSTGMLVGAEALVRWKHPEKGIISPGVFIPVFEKNGFITTLDMYVFEGVCQFIKECMDNTISVVPISINLTRYDIFIPNFIDMLESVRRKYNIPSKYLRVEITESAALGGSKFINEAVKKLHSFGFIVEMDDFGSGYSSLNILKDIDFDIIKLDMKFLDNEESNDTKGGTILSSVIRMVNWLGLPIIAEGVETVPQADFLRSLGCDHIQGYVYSKPLPEDEFREVLMGNQIRNNIGTMQFGEAIQNGDFWSVESLDAIIFNSFVGAAAIFEYDGENGNILRVNKNYLKELSMNLTEKDVINEGIFNSMDKEDIPVFKRMLETAIETNEEQECESWTTIISDCCGEDRLCIRTTVKVIGKSKNKTLFYSMIRNVTKEKMQSINSANLEKRFMAASEQANIYFWEYIIATKEMKPCFRCMRDLGLPPLMRNYPDSAIEAGVFPPDYADMYRNWHKQIEQGVESLEAIIPLTVGRVPFHVRYTTEFDENGRPIKAYGSATLVVD